uniref:PDZ domain-containing protein n=1 Tax=Strigamia maritima TaxID=126957 RepID=T1JJI4_STRMM
DSGGDLSAKNVWRSEDSEDHPAFRPISRPQYREPAWDSPSGGGSERSTPLASPVPSPNLGRWAATVPPLPSALERTVKVKKGPDQLGINVEAVDKGLNGVVIQSITAGGAIEADGRLQVGDYLISLNHESLRRISNSQARAILRRTQLVTSDVSITYIPGPDAAVHRDSSEEHSITEDDYNANSTTPDGFPPTQIISKNKYQRLDSMTDTSSSVISSTKTPDSDSRTSPEPKISRIPSSSTSSSLSPAYISELVAQSSPTTEASVSARAWGEERTVQVLREQGRSLGISIVGGKVDLCNSASGSTITGIFIKNVLPDSPAGCQGILKTGDRILEVDGVDLRNASHVRAVEIIRDAGNPIRFLVQSLVYWPKETNGESLSPPEEVPREPTSSPVNVHDEPETQFTFEETVLDVPDLVQMTEESRQESKSEQMELGYESECEEDEVITDLVFSKAAYIPANEEIHRASAASLKKSPNDPESDDEFGYTEIFISPFVLKKPFSGMIVCTKILEQPFGETFPAGKKADDKLTVLVMSDKRTDYNLCLNDEYGTPTKRTPHVYRFLEFFRLFEEVASQYTPAISPNYNLCGPDLVPTGHNGLGPNPPNLQPC